jgi:hypothetical protein
VNSGLKETQIMTSYGKLTAGLIGAWFAFALTASALHLFSNPAAALGFSVAIAAGVPLIVFALWLAASKTFRQFALSLNPRILTFLQSARIIGVVFVLLEARQLLPARFAFSAGYGDMFIGATAWFAATALANPARRGWFIFWQALGITDLVSAVALGVTQQFVHASAPSMYPMTVLPLSLIPTFGVPLFMMFHVISIAQARRWADGSADSRIAGKVVGRVAA